MPPKSQPNGKAPRARRTRAQIHADLVASGIPVASKPNAAAVKRSRLAAEARARGQPDAQSGAAKGTKDSPPLDLIDYQTVIAYLSRPSFRNAVFGGGSQTRVSGLPMGPSSLLNPLAIELNHDYNMRHNTTSMRLTGRVLHLRLKRYKGKYMAAHNFSLKTGNGLSAKNRADGIHTIEDLLESMCPCYKEMDAIFRDRGNVTAFGILDTGLGPHSNEDNDSEEEMPSGIQDPSDGDITDGHDHTLELSPKKPKRNDKDFVNVWSGKGSHHKKLRLFSTWHIQQRRDGCNSIH